MDQIDIDNSSVDQRIAGRLRQLRTERGWSLDELSKHSGVSRATLSRLENVQVSPTTSVLAKLCAAFGVTMSRLMHMAEEQFVPFVPRNNQPIWRDPELGFERRTISPPALGLTGEALECRLMPDTQIAYDEPPRAGLEHHLVLIDGRLDITVDAETFMLRPGDCLRYRLFGASRFVTPADCGARYLLFMV